MPTGWLYAVGTLLCWVGIGCAVSAIYRVIQMARPEPGAAPNRTAKAALFNAVVGGVSLLASAPLLKGHEGGSLFIPVVWFIMPFAAWCAVLFAGLAIMRLAQLPLSVSETRPRIINFFCAYVVCCFVALWFYRIDSSNSISLLKGAIPLSLPVALGIVACAIAAILGTVFSAGYAKTRGYAKGTAIFLSLFIGSILFGIPFLWLLITSFKEDIDMASPNGLVWIPRVQDTVPYFNKADPLLQHDYQGQPVTAQIQSKNPDGTVVVNILSPAAIAGHSFAAPLDSFKVIPKDAGLVWTTYKGERVKAFITDEMPDGSQKLEVLEPSQLKGADFTALPANTTPIRHIGLKWQNYPLALDYLPVEGDRGLTYLGNTLYLVFFSVIGTLLSSSLVAYAFSRMRFPGREFLFRLMLSTMMLPAAVTMLPQFLIYRQLGWIDTLRPLWVPAFLGSAFNIFLLRQFLLGIPMELEDAAKIDGCTYLRTYWSVMLPQIKPALAVIGIWTFMGAWNNFMGPLIYISSPEHMPISYALQMFNSDRGGEPGMLMALTTLSMLPVLALFFFAQRYFIEGVTLSGLGGR